MTVLELVIIGLMGIIIILAISMLWTNWTGAPWVPTPMRKVRKMLEMAEVGPEDVVYDLGSGDGRLVIMAARKFGARAVGIEISLLRYLWSKLEIYILELEDQVEIIRGDFFSQDLREATVVTCYLLQRTNNKLEVKLLDELRPGSRVVSHTFTFPSLPDVRQEDDLRLYHIYPDKYEGLRRVLGD